MQQTTIHGESAMEIASIFERLLAAHRWPPEFFHLPDAAIARATAFIEAEKVSLDRLSPEMVKAYDYAQKGALPDDAEQNMRLKNLEDDVDQLNTYVDGLRFQ